jgi:hypothetical protein
MRAGVPGIERTADLDQVAVVLVVVLVVEGRAGHG